MRQQLFLTAVLLAVLTTATHGQQLLPTQSLVHGGLGAVDDVVTSPSGDLYLSFPQQGIAAVETITPQGVVWTPIATGLFLAMELEPSGTALWTADYNTGVVARVNLASGVITQSYSGFGHPIDLVFKDASTLLVGGLDVPDNLFGIGTVYEINIQAPPSTPPIVLATGFVGALDMVFNSEGRLFVVSVSSQNLDEVDLVTGVVAPIMGNLLQPSDMLMGPDNGIYICTLLAAEVLLVHPDLAGVTAKQIDAPIGGVLGPGCEDMAFDTEGQLLITLTNGELHKVLLQNEIVKEGYPVSGATFNLILRDPARGSWSYQILASLSVGSMPIGGVGIIPMAPDFLFQESLNPASTFFTGFSGTLNPQGHGMGTVHIPVLPPSMTFDVYFGVGLFDVTGPVPQIALPDFIRSTIISF